MATNILTAAFAAGTTQTKTAALYQWDYGQVLKITGLDLPDAFEAHFTNQLGSGWAKTQIGTTEDGVGSVPIPDSYLEPGTTIYCYIYLHSGETDGETEYMVTIPVKSRAVPLNEAVTHEEQGVIQQYMAALMAAANRAEQEAGAASDSATESATSAGESAASAADAAQQAIDAAQQAAEAAQQAQAAAESAQDAAGSAGDASGDAGAAAEAAEDAEAWAVGERGGVAVPDTDETHNNNARYYAGRAATSASEGAASAVEASSYATQAAQQAAEALAQAQAALAQAQAAAQSAAAALAQAQASQTARAGAETAQSAAETAQEGAEQAKADTEALLATKGDGLSYDAGTGALDLLSGQSVLSSVVIEAGGDYFLTYDAATGRLSLLKDGAEISYVILSGLPVTITQEGDVLHVNNVPAVSSIVQIDTTLALT